MLWMSVRTSEWIESTIEHTTQFSFFFLLLLLLCCLCSFQSGSFVSKLKNLYKFNEAKCSSARNSLLTSIVSSSVEVDAFEGAFVKRTGGWYCYNSRRSKYLNNRLVEKEGVDSKWVCLWWYSDLYQQRRFLFPNGMRYISSGRVDNAIISKSMNGISVILSPVESNSIQSIVQFEFTFGTKTPNENDLNQRVQMLLCSV